MINLVFSAWLLFSGYRGYRNGWLATLLGLIGFVVAYLVCFLGMGALTSVLRNAGVNALYAMLLSAFLLFWGASLLFTALRWLLAWAGYLEQHGRSIAGALLGLIAGVVSGLLFVWMYGLLKVTFDSPPEAGLIERQANAVIGGLAGKGVDVLGVKGVKAAATQALFREPQNFVHSVKSLSQSRELNDFFRDENMQALLASDQIDEIVESSQFEALAEQEGTRIFLKYMDDERELGKRELAQDLAMVWQRVQQLKNDPEVERILNDKEISALIEKKDPLALLQNEKVQRLVDRIMDENLEATHAAALSNSEPKTIEQSREVKNTAIYQWRDDDGNIQFSDFQNIPPNKRDSAVQVGGQ